MCMRERTIITKSTIQTKQFAWLIAKKVARMKSDHARVLALTGNLGAGKTTFVQGFAAALGIKEKIQSPTFVLMKIYLLNAQKNFKHLVHIDAYRIEMPQELEHLGFHELAKDKDAIILIEWADLIKKLLPNDAIWITFGHGKKANERIIRINGVVSAFFTKLNSYITYYAGRDKKKRI